MRNIIYSALFLGALSACAPAVPDSAAGVGFDNSPQAQRAREAALTAGTGPGQPLAAPMAVASEPLAPAAGAATAPAVAQGAQPMQPAPVPMQTAAGAGADSAADIAAETAAALAAASANSGQMPLQASPSNPAPMPLSNPGISDENDFAAVASRETIASDAERIARNRAQYAEIAPTALPSRSDSSQPNIVKYALQTRHPRGTQMYNRSGLGRLVARTTHNCDKYGSADLAQIDFLSKGGPQRDRKGLDPDGDGYACGWDPEPFRRAVQN